MARVHEFYLPIYCPKENKFGRCNTFLFKIAITHHSLVGIRCHNCGSIWRIFHGSDEIQVEMSLMEKLLDSPVKPIVQVSWGRIENKPEMEIAKG